MFSPSKILLLPSHTVPSLLGVLPTFSGTRCPHMQWNQVSPHAVEPGLPTCSGTRSPHMQWNQVSPHAVEPGLPTCSGTRFPHMQWNQVSPHAVESGLLACNGNYRSRQYVNLSHAPSWSAIRTSSGSRCWFGSHMSCTRTDMQEVWQICQSPRSHLLFYTCYWIWEKAPLHASRMSL